jgi:hypothetical protein
VHNVGDVRQMEVQVHMAEPLVPVPSHHAVETAIAKLKKYKSPLRDQIPAELIQAGGETSTNSLILLGIRKNCLISGRSGGEKTDCNYYRQMSLLSTSYKMLSNILLSRLSPYIVEIIGGHRRGFCLGRSTTHQIVCIRQILEKKLEHNETVHQLFIDFDKAYYSTRREVLYNILIEFGVPMKLVRLIKMC